MLAGLDIGTTTVKFSIYYENGILASESASPYPGSTSKSCISGILIWNTVKKVIKLACQNLPAGAAIHGMAVSGFGETIIPVGANDKVLYNSFLGNAPEGAMELTEILGKISPDQIHKITGLIPGKHHSAVKIRWFQNHTDIYQKVKKFFMVEDFIIYMLTGEAITSVSSAARSMLLCLETEDWDPTLLNITHIDREKLSKIQPSGTLVGEIKNSLCLELGITPGTLVFTGGHDQLCNAIGAGLKDDETVINCSGTVECISHLITKKINKNTELFQLSPFCSALPNAYYTFRAPVRGCSALDQFLLSSGISKEHLSQTHITIQKQCEQSPSPALCFIRGSGNGIQDSINKPIEADRKMSKSKSLIAKYQSMLESIAFEDKAILTEWENAGLPVKRVFFVGGGAQSDYWAQMKADIWEIPVFTLQSSQAGTMGCMLLAAVGTGTYGSLQTAFTHCILTKQIFEPNTLRAQRYKQKYAKYMSIRS